MGNKVKSMTGFGRSQCSLDDGRIIVVEVRTLNSIKGVDISLRMPSFCRVLESQVRSLAVQRAIRGKVDLSISLEGAQIESGVQVNGELFSMHKKRVMELVSSEGLIVSDDAIFSMLMRIPDVLSVQKHQEITQAEGELLLDAVSMAMDNLDSHRLVEGAVLVADILGRVAVIERLAEECSGYDSERIDGVRQRLSDALERVQGLSYDNNRFEAELIYYLEKFDITEERVRLGQHIVYFREVLAEGGDVGRRLGFILQEFGREINTTGSKSNHSSMQRLVVMMKDEMEKIKEQSLNIL